MDLAMKHEEYALHRFFWPESVAIVGATNNPFKMNFRILENLVKLNYQGKIYPVNPSSQEILGLKAYPSLEAIHEKVDLVVSAVPAAKTMDIILQCSRKGVKQLVIVTGGFSEGGDEGKRLHQEIASFIRRNGIRTLGPNTLSPINTANNLIISFNPVKEMRRGNISFAFQSGFYEPKLNWLFSHMGVGKMLDMGNKMDLNEVDALAYFSQDPDTRVIAMHIESLRGDPQQFFDLLKSTTTRKPVIILKAGRTSAGSRAAASHTGSIARENNLIFESALRQAGAIRAANMEEFFDLAKAFEFLDLPAGNRLSIITLSGGEGVMATDACEMNGLTLARFGPKTHEALKKIFPPWEIPLNPFDAGVCMEFHLADLENFFKTFTAITEDANVDCILMQMPPNFNYFMSSMHNIPEEMLQSMTEEYLNLLLSMKRPGKPFAMWCSALVKEEMELIELLESRGLPVFPSAERAIRAFAALYRYRNYREQICAKDGKRGDGQDI
ncbi:MAG: CoA-binding protein [Deltaproteobacteria bacterium]|nr:CoA-binding protein [Deltaproteobacteria bacterium]